MTLEEIIEEYAIDHGYENAENMWFHGIQVCDVINVAYRYSETFRKGFEAQQEVNLALIEQNRELVKMLEQSLGALNDCCMVIDSEDEVFEYVKALSVDLTKSLFNYRPKINVK